MTLIDFIREFFNLPTLAGIIILTRFIRTQWIVIAIGVALIILGLIFGSNVL